MQTTKGRYKNPLCRVTMEPALEAEAALWTERQCLEEARLMERYARQLRMRAKIMRIDRLRALERKAVPSLKVLPLRILVRN